MQRPTRSSSVRPTGVRATFLAIPVAIAALLFPSCGEESAIPDTTPPAAITDLVAEAYTPGSVALRWTAPGDDGETGQARWYDVRYHAGDLAGSWETATPVASPPSPRPAGERDVVIVRDLTAGTWEFGVRTADEALHWSDLSNVATFTLVAPDTIPPAAIDDLVVTGFTRNTVTLEWTAPGDDGTTGRASSYDLRYASGTIDEAAWDGATPVPDVPQPAASGSRQAITVIDLPVPGEYAFALRSGDEKGNLSGLSNAATVALTLEGPFQLTFSDNYYGAYDPEWSPDGLRIAYIAGHEFSAETIRPQIHVVSSGGGEPVRYTSFLPEGASSPSWSPDGTRFAFQKLVTDNRSTWGALAVMDAVPGADYRVLMNHGLGQSVGQVAWSPDGAVLAYMVNKGSPPGPFVNDLYTIPPSGGTPTPILRDVVLAGFSWSPDASRIVYSIRESGVFNLRILVLGDGTSTALTEGTEDRRSPDWSATDEIAYLSGGAIWILPAAGGTPRIGSTDAGALYGPLAWSPDGSKIAYVKYESFRSDVWITPLE